ncbi:MAG: hypothetical protein E7168_02000 [Firmicutes bacterium]|nr:hypothetical protein [Bacillota bacterium]
MFETALKLLAKIEENGFKAYVVGGFVRDYLLGIESHDIDVCTNAKPKDIRAIFKDACLPREAYGSITVIIKNVRFEITTFRKEYSYINYRKPIDFEYINDLHEDLKRRDFLINTLCIDRYGNVLDILNGKEDLNNREINTVGDSVYKFTQDAFRILRAVRIATTLHFKLSDEVYQAILETKHLLKNISYQRKKEELDKIFTSTYVEYGVQLLLELGLDLELDLPKLKDVSCFDDLVGVWTQLDVLDVYPFTNNERDLILGIKAVLDGGSINSRVLYNYGLYVVSIAANICGIDKKEITAKYQELPIKSKNEIVVNGMDISNYLKRKPDKYLKEIMNDLESKIINCELLNEKDCLLDYIGKTYR